jgi:hypothetical protein
MIILTKIRSLFNPAMYQGWGSRRKYFEGWYFKVVYTEETKAFVFIPGIAMDESGESHAFIQLLDGKAKKAEYFTFDATLFRPSERKFDVAIGANRFSAGGLTFDMPAIRGTLRFRDIVPWPSHWYSPGIMGPYTFAPFMECNHGIVSMDHSLEGTLVINGEETDFTGGRGYIEKDWGHSFPSAYVWMQSNHFDQPGISFKASVARIPWVTGNFTGFIAGFWSGNRLYRFTEYNRSCLTMLRSTDQGVELEFRNRLHILRLAAPADRTTSLAAPIRGLMDGRTEESMTSVISLTLTDSDNGHVIFSGKGRNGSVEISGDIQSLSHR